MSLKSIYLGEPRLFVKGNLKPTVILLLAALLPVLHRYLGSLDLYTQSESMKMTLTNSNDWLTVNFFFITAFIFKGIIPFIVMIYFLKENPKDFGLQFGDWKTGWKTVAILFPIIAVALLLPAGFQKDFQNIYPLYKGAGDSVSSFLGFELLRGIFYYTGWEFLYRGFLLFGMRKYVGDWTAILIQIIPSCLDHIGYPPGEILMSIPAGILFGVMAIKTRSIFWPLLLHWLIGLATDAFIVIIR
jgi:membrane protease YdiL (CAAX protease family)